jgi:MarR family 2-MHQ and catechol resistance regulon transcriptional repressor
MPTHHQGTPEEVLALNTYIKLSRAVNAFDARLARHNPLDDLTGTQFAVLEALYHLGPLSQTEIGAKLLKSGGNITLVIDNLERHGYVARRRCDSDRRIVYVDLTPAGQAKIAAIFPRQLAAIVAEMSVLTPAEQEELSRLLKKLGRAGEPALNGSKPVVDYEI